MKPTSLVQIIMIDTGSFEENVIAFNYTDYHL